MRWGLFGGSEGSRPRVQRDMAVSRLGAEEVIFSGFLSEDAMMTS